jgi:hypothetical protein
LASSLFKIIDPCSVVELIFPSLLFSQMLGEFSIIRICVCVCVCIIYVVVVYTASHYVIDLKLTLVFLFFWVVLAVQEFEVETSLLLGRHSMI